ncbi:MAG: dephospho-CoA kinase [Candidatus Marinimicrobia bacterium]|jgi:dephospho-CoA kinase|nr:dephospho-CoA kinase [Candidatus Neomarinimicrobiota bacterium]MBT3575274.1 dephospho-CoA kinase [Candidatus Neomarinimicrobiota bacterium]MBT3680373.1 dephospho-CoA kinase [Candidatus Neomarinimicrobiota bacterium]MBT3951802.1 dephospho-CoA kinase [Candidatus Neomarinimicrobiota bacterium]MBT4252764.1 dephospho-CoA kinase [Candidatus Neomarinimicrobiota bacterium]
MYILGVTGNIGSGKSTVSHRLAHHGAVVSHSDPLAKEILQNDPEILASLAQRFGTDILNEAGILQKHILAERAFSTRDDQLFLNHLIHPEVRRITLDRIEIARSQGKSLFVVDAPLLFEAHADSITDGVLVVVADRMFREGRVERRSSISKVDFERRDALQMPIDEKIRRADYVIDNDGTLIELLSKVDIFYKDLKL